jgi:DNA-directed RNA polymerase subunit RPC12/RpoP
MAKMSASSPDTLVCPACGSREQFIEVMESEAHLVDGKRNYVRLIEGVTDHYICFACGETFESNSTEQ